MGNLLYDLFEGGFGLLVFLVLLYVIIWFITRELRCWYWKINRQISILESIDNRLASLQQLMVQGNTVNSIITGELSNIAAGLEPRSSSEQINTNDELPEL